MFHLVYVSTAVRLFAPADLQLLLEQSRSHNAKWGITGLLLYRDGSFMQVLEGAQEPVLSLYDTICDDTRHTDVTFMIDGESEQQFPDWSMAFGDYSERSPARWSDPDRRYPFDDRPHPTRVQRLLRSFRRSTTWR